MYLTTSVKKGIYFGSSKILGVAIVLHTEGLITLPAKEFYHEYEASLERDENDNPIWPDLGVETHFVEEQFEQDIKAYLDENGDASISELQFDIDNKTFSIDETLKLERRKKEEFEPFKADRLNYITACDNRLRQNDREKRLSIETTLSDSEINQIDQNIQEWVEFKDNFDPDNPTPPAKLDFV